MVYRLIPSQPEIIPLGVDREYNTTKKAMRVVKILKEEYPSIDIVILKDGIQLTIEELQSDIDSYEINTMREEDVPRQNNLDS